MSGLLERLRQEIEIRNFSKKTLKAYLYSVEKFLEFSENLGLNEDSVKIYIQKNLDKKNPVSVRRDLFAIKFFFENILHQKLNVPNPKKNNPLPVILTIDEIRKLIESTNNIKHKLIIKLLYGCGLRVSEIVNLNKKDINFNENLIYIKLSKGKKDRFVKIPSSIFNELKSYCNLNKKGSLFPSNRGGKLTKKTIQKIVQNSARKSGIRKRVYISQASIKNIKTPFSYLVNGTISKTSDFHNVVGKNRDWREKCAAE